MKLTIERSALLKTLGHVRGVVEKHGVNPILSNVQLVTHKGCLKATGTDTDIEIVESVAADITRDGCTTVPARTVYDIINKLPDGALVELDLDDVGGELVLRAGRAKFSLACRSVADFPDMPHAGMTHTFTMAAAELRGLIDRTKFAISTEETRFYLNGIFLHAAPHQFMPQLRAVATDGHRMALAKVSMPVGAAGMPGVIIPRKTVMELRKLIDGVTADVTVSLSGVRLRFAFDAVMLTSKLIDSTFPDYERVIPVENDKTMEVDRQQFAEAVSRVTAISSEKSRAVKVNIERGNVTLSASSPESGSASEEMDVIYTDAPIEIGFNSRYLLDILSQGDGDMFQFAMSDSGSPTVVRDLSDPTVTYVLMPMRV